MTDKFDTSEGVALFTDGSAYTRDRSGGWAFVGLDAFGGYFEQSGAAADTTISQMELFAATNGLFYIVERYGACDVLVYSDSEYVVLGMNDKNRARIANVSWWEDLEVAVASHNHVEFQHVRGHQNSKHNNRADKLAGIARRNGVK